MTVAIEFYQWLRDNPCPCDVDSATICTLAAAATGGECGCKCHKKILDFKQDRRYV